MTDITPKDYVAILEQEIGNWDSAIGDHEAEIAELREKIAEARRTLRRVKGAVLLRLVIGDQTVPRAAGGAPVGRQGPAGDG